MVPFRKRIKKFFLGLAAFFLTIVHSTGAYAVCAGLPIDPITDVCWQCIFPLKIAGVTVVPGVGLPDAPDLSSLPICICPLPPPLFARPGIPVSFWEPARLVETVKDPFCFPSLGKGLPPITPAALVAGGGRTEPRSGSNPTGSVFQQAHYFIFPAWAVLELFLDMYCMETSGFDLAYMTEVDPLWNSDFLAFIIQPEALLFANPVAQLACIADSVTSQVGLPLDPLFWCMGSWGSAYPLSGHIGSDLYVQSNGALTARMIYKLSREFLICDTSVTLCGCIPMPIWIKSHYRLQISKPIRDFLATPIGRTGLIWGVGKDPPFIGDNFMWVIFRKRSCCVL